MPSATQRSAAPPYANRESSGSKHGQCLLGVTPASSADHLQTSATQPGWGLSQGGGSHTADLAACRRRWCALQALISTQAPSWTLQALPQMGPPTLCCQRSSSRYSHPRPLRRNSTRTHSRSRQPGSRPPAAMAACRRLRPKPSAPAWAPPHATPPSQREMQQQHMPPPPAAAPNVAKPTSPPACTPPAVASQQHAAHTLIRARSRLMRPPSRMLPQSHQRRPAPAGTPNFGSTNQHNAAR